MSDCRVASSLKPNPRSKIEWEIHLIRELNCVIEACISSKVFPLVSGTSFAIKTTVEPQRTEKIKNVPGGSYIQY